MISPVGHRESRTERLLAEDHQAAAQILERGGTVGLPTETVYGLAADAADDLAVAKIFAAKGRPAGHPLIVHVASIDEVPAWADVSDQRVQALADAFWPGPLTLILPRTDLVSPLVVGDRTTVGVRVPDHPVARAVLNAFAEIGSGGVAAPSANRFGHVSPTTADHVVDDLDGRIDAVIDGGMSTVGVESTIIELVGEVGTLLRPGGVSGPQIEAVLGEPLVDGRGGASRAAGMMASHYAPRAKVIIVDRELVGDSNVDSDVAVIGPVDTAGLEPALSLWLPDDAAEYAASLYRALRAADAFGVERIIVVPPTTGPLLDAVLDRLAKASA